MGGERRQTYRDIEAPKRRRGGPRAVESAEAGVLLTVWVGYREGPKISLKA